MAVPSGEFVHVQGAPASVGLALYSGDLMQTAPLVSSGAARPVWASASAAPLPPKVSLPAPMPPPRQLRAADGQFEQLFQQREGH